MTDQSIAARLGQCGVCICPNFFSLADWTGTRLNLDAIYNTGIFRRAGTGFGLGRANSGSVRNDQIHWLGQFPAIPEQALLWRRLEELKQAFNRNLFLGLNDFEGHYSIYPMRGFYRRHLDRFRDDGDRVVSFILYLNQEWTAPDGGQLRIYNSDGSQTDIEPRGGTMVCFLSGELEHEVLLNHAPRFSFTGWFKRSSKGPT